MFESLPNPWVIVVMVLLFNLTIFVHELGHFLVAKWRGIKVERFAVWFGPAIWKRTWRGVEYRWGCIPLGGYVAIPQLAMEAIEGKSETPVEQLPPMRARDKIPILLAGSVFNVILGFLIACILWKVGIPVEAGFSDVIIGSVDKGSPEEAAGLRPWDHIVSIDDIPVSNWEEVRIRVAVSLQRRIRIGIERQGKFETIEVVPDRDKLLNIRELNVDHVGRLVVVGMDPDLPAMKAGLRPGDQIREVDGERLTGIGHLRKLVGRHEKTPARLAIVRDGRRVELDVQPVFNTPTDGEKPTLVIGVKEWGHELTYPTPWAQVKSSLMLIADTFLAIKHRRTTGVGVSDLAGPVGIGHNLYLSIKSDIRHALKFLVMLNINLAVVNLLPIPVLDGGHILITLIEKIRRKPLNQKLVETVHVVCLVLLLSFMAFTIFNDSVRMNKINQVLSERKAPAAKTAVEKTPPAKP